MCVCAFSPRLTCKYHAYTCAICEEGRKREHARNAKSNVQFCLLRSQSGTSHGSICGQAFDYVHAYTYALPISLYKSRDLLQNNIESLFTNDRFSSWTFFANNLRRTTLCSTAISSDSRAAALTTRSERLCAFAVAGSEAGNWRFKIERDSHLLSFGRYLSHFLELGNISGRG